MKSSNRFTSFLAVGVCVIALGTACGDGDDGEASAAEPSETTLTADGAAQTATLTPVEGMNAEGAGTVPDGISDDGVIGGQAIEIEEVPWTVALVNPGQTDNFCGGVLIAPTRVLTAAHCTQDVKRDRDTGLPVGTAYITGPANINVVAGRTRLNEQGGQEVAVTRVWQHPDYDNIKLTNDYAFLDLAEPINQTVIAVPANTDTGLWGKDVFVEIAGWGCQRPAQPWPDCEDTGGSPLVTNTFLATDGTPCRSIYRHFDPETVLCLQTTDADSNSCSGDSGGPYFVEESTTHVRYVVALVSYGKPGCQLNQPVGGALLAPILDDRGQISGDITWNICSDNATRCTYRE
jgi:secreted trypsin-like serine protease